MHFKTIQFLGDYYISHSVLQKARAVEQMLRSEPETLSAEDRKKIEDLAVDVLSLVTKERYHSRSPLPREWLGEFKYKPGDKQGRTRCPSCEELTEVGMVSDISPPIHNYQCSRGHSWTYQEEY